MRTRFISAYLGEFGWEPIVVTVDPVHFEEVADPASATLIPAGVRVERTGAWSKRICRSIGLGDLSLRAQFQLRRKVAELIRSERINLIFCTVLPGYNALIGAWAKRKFGIPFVLDYQDPWVTDWGSSQPRLSKAGLAHLLAVRLEPLVHRYVDAVTAVSDATLDTLRQRNLLKLGIKVRTLPIGADQADYNVAAGLGRFLIPSGPTSEAKAFEVVYLGTLTERMLPALRSVLHALSQVAVKSRLNLSLIGTSAQPNGIDRLGLDSIARECGAGGLIRVEPRRVPYLDALRTMQKADLLLLIGSTDRHYTASKLFPCWLSGRAILGVFHEDSTIVSLSAELGGVRLITYKTHVSPETKVQEVRNALQEIVDNKAGAVPPRHEEAFEPYSARGVARRFADLFDQVLASSSNGGYHD